MGKSLYYLVPKGFQSKFPLVFETLRFIKNQDYIPFLKFYFDNDIPLSKKEKASILNRLFSINMKVNSPHRQYEILGFISKMLQYKDIEGDFVECGCFKGSSTSKFSIIAKLLNKKLYVFDSFEGIPDNNENHDYNIYGEASGFKQGDFSGSLEEVKNNVRKYGEIDSCIFTKGWFDNTLPNFKGNINAVYIDVDLASSTKTCLKYFYPMLNKGGVIMSQDGHLPLVIDVFKDKIFWTEEMNSNAPNVEGLGKDKLIYFTK